MPETLWYIRSRGRVSGPFTARQLESMRERGQISRFHEVSTDRQGWMSAARVPELFPPAEARQPAPVSESYAVGGPDFSVGEARGQPLLALPASDDAGSSWFYARGGTHHGPVSYEDLRRMAAQGEIGAETLLWKSGMADWAACRSFPDLVSLSQAAHTSLTAPFSPQTHWGYGFAADPQFLPRTSGLAVASLVLGILWLCGGGSLLATIFGAVALGQIARSNGRLTGKAMAVAGLVLGIIGLGLLAFPFFHGTLSSAIEWIQGRRF
jgi:hypothetical protein